MPTKDEMMKFSLQIEKMVASTDYTYLEAIAEHCKETGLELEVAATLITPNLAGLHVKTHTLRAYGCCQSGNSCALPTLP